MNKTTIWNRNFILVFIVNICAAMSFHILTPTLPKYSLSLGLSTGIAGVISTAFVITAILIRPFSGQLADKKNKKILLIIALCFVTVAIAGYALSKTMVLLIFFRLIHGIGWGIATTVVATMAANSLPEDKMGRGIGIFGLASVIAMGIAPNFGLMLESGVGFFWMFTFAGSMAVIGIILCFFINLDENIKKETTKNSQPVSIISRIFAREALLPSILILIIGAGTTSISTFIAVYAEQLHVAGIGNYFTVYALALFISRPLSGRLSDTIKKPYILFPCMILVISVFIMIHFATSLAIFLIAAAIFGLGYGGLQPTMQIWCVRSVPPERRGMASSTYFIGLDSGVGIGSMLAGFVAGQTGFSNMYLWMIVPIVLAMIIYSASLITTRGGNKLDSLKEKQIVG